MTPVALAAQKTRLRVQGIGQFLGHSMDAVLVVSVAWRSNGNTTTVDVLYIVNPNHLIMNHYCQAGSIWFLLQIPAHRVRITVRLPDAQLMRPVIRMHPGRLYQNAGMSCTCAHTLSSIAIQEVQLKLRAGGLDHHFQEFNGCRTKKRRHDAYMERMNNSFGAPSMARRIGWSQELQASNKASFGSSSLSAGQASCIELMVL